MLEPAFTGVFPAFHMELVKLVVPSKRNPGAERRLRRPLTWRRGDSALWLQKYWTWICAKFTVNIIPCKVCLASPQLLATRVTEGNEIVSWEHNYSVKQPLINSSESHIKIYEEHICMSQLKVLYRTLFFNWNRIFSVVECSQRKRTCSTNGFDFLQS